MRIVAMMILALIATPALAGSTCIDLGGGMVSCSGSDGSNFTGMDLGGGMRTYNGQIGGRDFNATEMDLGGGISTFNGNVGRQPFNQTCVRTGNIVTCN